MLLNLIPGSPLLPQLSRGDYRSNSTSGLKLQTKQATCVPLQGKSVPDRARQPPGGGHAWWTARPTATLSPHRSCESAQKTANTSSQCVARSLGKSTVLTGQRSPWREGGGELPLDTLRGKPRPNPRSEKPLGDPVNTLISVH